MRTLELVNHLTDAQLKEHLGTASGKPEFSRWQILYMVQVAGIGSASVISPLVNLSRSSVYKIIEQYNKAGVSGIKYTLRGGRRRSLLSQSAESDLLDTIEQKAVKGLIKTANDIRVIVEAKVGKAVSDDYLWDLLKPRLAQVFFDLCLSCRKCFPLAKQLRVFTPFGASVFSLVTIPPQVFST